MAEKTTLARVYAKAAFEYALANNCISDWSVILDNLSLVANHEQVKKIVKNPAYTSTQLADFYIGIIGLYKNKHLCNFISILAENCRLDLFDSIAALYHKLKLAHENIINVCIISAFGLHDEQKKLLSSSLEKKFNSKINIEYKADESLIGGLIAKVGDDVIDGSVRGYLEQLSKQLAA